MKKVVIGVFLLLLGTVWLTQGWSQPLMKKKKMYLGVKKFCEMHPQRPSCQRFKKLRQELRAALREVRRDIREFCKQNPEDAYCQQLRKIIKERKQNRIKTIAKGVANAQDKN